MEKLLEATDTPNYTPELAQLLKFAGETATAIRLYSHYTGGAPRRHGQLRDPAMAPVDIMFLSDAITQLLGVGAAVESGDGLHILRVCREVRALFESYASDNPQFDPQAKPTFDFWADSVDLAGAVVALNSIESKTAGGKPEACASNAEPTHTIIQAPTRTGMSPGLCDHVDLQFPAALRKMWSGSEVQAWLDQLPPMVAAPCLQRREKEMTDMTPENQIPASHETSAAIDAALGLETLTVRLSSEALRRLELGAADQGTPTQALVRNILQSYAAGGTITLEVIAERARQDAKWGGPEHDDQHGLADFCGFINQRTADLARGFETTEHARKRMIQIAALAVAAVESIDRKNGFEAQS